MASQDHRGWRALGMHAYYLLGATYYLYHWLIIAGVGGLTAAGIIQYANANLKITITIIVAISALFLLSGIALLILNFRRRYRSANPGLKILSSESLYRVSSNTDYEYVRKITAMASLDGVNTFVHRFIWTGTGTIDVSTDTPGYSISLEDDNLTPRRKLVVRFDRSKRKREKFSFTYKFAMHDDAHTARNFLRTTIPEKVRHMQLRVSLPATICPAQFRRAMYMSSVSDIPVYEEMVATDGNTMLEWKIRHPRLDYEYGLFW